MRVSAILLVAAVLAAPVSAQTNPKKQSDPNRVICRTQDVIGSRLQTQRKCMTAQEWTRLEREQRETVEKVQNAKFSQGR